MPPATPSTRLSASSWRIRCPRPAPSAARIASSRRRPVARAMSRLETFAHAISRTSPTAPWMTSSASRTSPTSILADRRDAHVRARRSSVVALLDGDADSVQILLRLGPASRPVSTAPIAWKYWTSRLVSGSFDVDRRRRHRQRRQQPELRALRPGEAVRHHRRDRVGLAVDPHRAARRRAASLPNSRCQRGVAEHDELLAAAAWSARANGRPERRRRAEDVEERRTSPRPPRTASARPASPRPPPRPRGIRRSPRASGCSAGCPGSLRRSGCCRPRRSSSSTPSRPALRRGTGSGRSSTPLTTLKMAVLAAMPSAMVATAMAEEPGVLSSVRSA